MTNVSTIGTGCDYDTLTLWSDAKEENTEFSIEVAECIDNSHLPGVRLEPAFKDRKWIDIYVDKGQWRRYS